MALTWTAKRQLTIFLALAAALGIIIFAVIYSFLPERTCFDKKQNQNEEGIDCGGDCEACVKDAEEIVIHWTRFFEVVPGHWEVAALAENSNLLLGTTKLVYRVRLYDSNNILIALKEGNTFVNPREKFLIYERDIATFERKPARAAIEFNPVSWKRFEKERPQIVVVSKEYSDDDTGSRVRAVVKNESLFDVEKISFSAVLSDSGGNAIGISAANAEVISGEGESEVFFTWRHPFDPEPARIEIFARTDLTTE